MRISDGFSRAVGTFFIMSLLCVHSATAQDVRPGWSINSAAGYRSIGRQRGVLHQGVLTMSIQGGTTPLDAVAADEVLGRMRIELSAGVPTPNAESSLQIQSSGDLWLGFQRSRGWGGYGLHLGGESGLNLMATYPAVGRIGVCALGPVAPEDSRRVNLYFCVDLTGGAGIDARTAAAALVSGFGASGAIAVPVSWNGDRRMRIEADFRLLSIARAEGEGSPRPAEVEDANAIVRYIISVQVPVPYARRLMALFDFQGSNRVRYGARGPGSVTGSADSEPWVTRDFYQLVLGGVWNY